MRPPCRGWFSLFFDAVSVFIQNETDLAQTKTKALSDSSLYGPYQALSSSNPLLQASFTGIANRKGINGECNFFKSSFVETSYTVIIDDLNLIFLG